MPENRRPWIKLSTRIHHNYELRQLTQRAQLTWIYLLAHCGDCGDGNEIDTSISKLAFHLGLDAKNLEMELAELGKAGFVKCHVDGVTIIAWDDHQTATPGAVRQKRYRDRQRDAAPSRVTSRVTDSDALDIEVDRDVDVEVEVEETKKRLATLARADLFPVFDHWQNVWGKRRAKFTPKRQKLIAARVKEGYSLEDLKQAITGYTNSPHHTGNNDSSTVYCDFELLLRDAKHVDAGIQFLERGIPADARSAGNRADLERVLDDLNTGDDR